ncbi:uncharacterized protein LOC133202839 [Saccostrea echinata]|uniref:uncharacterized protein LOC133202839 n=1 Tax=Saccostrea echinata TaxID=191078 RepID=UPI002A7EE853|nr:uncharacterized protein LOC133202839 [Saccostrea echinata]
MEVKERENSEKLRECLKNGSLTLRDLDNKKRGSSRGRRRRSKGKSGKNVTTDDATNTQAIDKPQSTLKASKITRQPKMESNSKTAEKSLKLKSQDKESEKVVRSILDDVIDQVSRYCSATKNSIAKEQTNMTPTLMGASDERVVAIRNFYADQKRATQQLLYKAAEENVKDLIMRATTRRRDIPSPDKGQLSKTAPLIFAIYGARQRAYQQWMISEKLKMRKLLYKEAQKNVDDLIIQATTNCDIPGPVKVEVDVPSLLRFVYRPVKVEVDMPSLVRSVYRPITVEVDIPSLVRSVYRPIIAEVDVSSLARSVFRPIIVDVPSLVRSVYRPIKLEVDVPRLVRPVYRPVKVEVDVPSLVRPVYRPVKVEVDVLILVRSVYRPIKVEVDVPSLVRPVYRPVKVEVDVPSLVRPVKVEVDVPILSQSAECDSRLRALFEKRNAEKLTLQKTMNNTASEVVEDLFTCAATNTSLKTLSEPDVSNEMEDDSVPTQKGWRRFICCVKPKKQQQKKEKKGKFGLLTRLRRLFNCR